MLAKQKKMEAEKIIQDRIDTEKQNEREKHQGLQKKFNKMEEKYIEQKGQLDQYKEQMQDARSKKFQSSIRKLDQLNNQKMNYKFLMMKKIVDKGQRGENVVMQNSILSETGYSNHREKLVSQFRSMTMADEEK